MARSRAAGLVACVAMLVCCVLSYNRPAQALRIELLDVAPDRIERQRAEAAGQLPLSGTPSISERDARLAQRGLKSGSPVLLRVFKAESELELWMLRGDRFELFSVYPICSWSGSLGPKLSEGDKQSPEGVYTVGRRQLHMIGRHPRSLNLGYPNPLDRKLNRTGSYILIHGGCGTVGCFAMTNPVMEEVFHLVRSALWNGQEAVHVHVFPFRMSEERLAAYSMHEWYDFWRNLKEVHDSFERVRLPPKISACDGRYRVEDFSPPQEAAGESPLVACASSQALPLWTRKRPAALRAQSTEPSRAGLRQSKTEPSSLRSRAALSLRPPASGPTRLSLTTASPSSVRPSAKSAALPADRRRPPS